MKNIFYKNVDTRGDDKKENGRSGFHRKFYSKIEKCTIYLGVIFIKTVIVCGRFMEGSLADWPPLSKFKIIAVSEEKATVLISPTLWLHNVSLRLICTALCRKST